MNGVATLAIADDVWNVHTWRKKPTRNILNNPFTFFLSQSSFIVFFIIANKIINKTAFADDFNSKNVAE